MSKSVLTRVRKGKAIKFLSAFLAVNILTQILFPSIAVALTAGPASPEFSSFEPVATTDMVNDFSGDFTYNLPVLNVPGPDGGGYSMSLSYHSGVSSEEEASWVGFGWTLNPGAINRQKRGIPDDFNNQPVTTYNKTNVNWTQTSKFDFDLEINSKDTQEKRQNTDNSKAGGKIAKKLNLPFLSNKQKDGGAAPTDPAVLSISLSHTIRYNNYSGFSIANSLGVGAFGMGNLTMTRSGGENTFGISVSPVEIMKKTGLGKKVRNKLEKSKKLKSALSKMDKFSEKMKKALKREKGLGGKAKMKTDLRPQPQAYSVRLYNAPAQNYSIAKNVGVIWNVSGSVKINVYTPVGFQIGIAGSLSMMANEGSANQTAYGYMYSNGNGTNDGDISHANTMFDYQVEKETTFSKYDKNIGVPFNNADVFLTSGNGVVGGFKALHSSIGHFYPNPSESKIRMNSVGVELGIGGTFQIGFRLGIGNQKTTVSGPWNLIDYPVDANNNENPSLIDFSTNLPQMRFTNDLGGEVAYDNDYNNYLNPTISPFRKLNLSNYDLSLDTKKAQNTSNINYTTDPTSGLINKISITNKDGSIVEYNETVMVQNETELTVGVDNYEDGKSVVYDQNIYAPLPGQSSLPMNNSTVVGEFSSTPYPTAYLITANKTFDYVDADGDGVPSQGDFGGWTKFNYRKPYGNSTGKWYRYRSPYNGLTYNNERVLNPEDQTGSMSSGEKEVKYLSTVETKTHVAFFITNLTVATDFSAYNLPAASIQYVTGSNVGRLDGVDAAIINPDGTDAAATSATARGSHVSENLERIVLFSKSDLTKPLSTTYFSYDYSLCQGIPNNMNSTSSAPANTKGKLTLTKVWTESGGVVKSRIAPYQFHYEYFKEYDASIVAKYPWASTFNGYSTSPITENPYYQPEQLDAWGFYQENGDQRFANMQPWLSQKTASSSFDPAAWQLKRIQLPSGGEIHIHYEQNNYRYVQDKLAMAMVSLLNDGSNQLPTDQGYNAGKTQYYINTDDLEIDAGGLSAYVDSLKSHFVTNNNKLYFKFLYRFKGGTAPLLNTADKDYGVDYVTGYTTVNDVTLEGGSKICLHLGDMSATPLSGVYDGDKDKTLPRYVGYQNLLSNGGIELGLTNSGYTKNDKSFTQLAYFGNPSSADLESQVRVIARDKVVGFAIDMFSDWVGGDVKNESKTNACITLNPQLSYFKLPIYKVKKGGGIRVQRLLTYDPGIETGDAMVYGSEYHYVNEDGTSSGVATNEPMTIREENALVEFMERQKQGGLESIVKRKRQQTI